MKGKNAMWFNCSLAFSKSVTQIAKMSTIYPNKLFSILEQIEHTLRKGKGIEEVES